MFSVEKITQIVGGELLRRETATLKRAIHDSRLVGVGDLFVALPGQRSDGHKFLAEAFVRGASAALVSETTVFPARARNLICVPDTAAALGQWAAAWRQSLDATIVAITGTNGKTTVKALLGHLLSSCRPAYVSPHNYNTEIGLPIALLSMPTDANVGVFELGAERPGDIALLADILQPHMGILTSVGPGHLDGLKTVAAVTSEKWSLIEHLPKDGTAFVNADVPPFLDLAASAHVPVVTAGLENGAIRGLVLQTAPNLKVRLNDQDITLSCPLVGTHNANNLLLAAAAANTLGISWEEIANHAPSFKPISHRLTPIQASFGMILDDTYNANPASMSAALDVLIASPIEEARRVFVFGEMYGLGTASARFHRDIAQQALSLPIDVILPIGDTAIAACHAVTVHSEDAARVIVLPRHEIVRWIHDFAPALVVLVKGSRALGLENLVDALQRL